jgi:hypothetical protein
MSAPAYKLLTPNEVVMQLTELGRELDAVVTTLRGRTGRRQEAPPPGRHRREPGPLSRRLEFVRFQKDADAEIALWERSMP